MSDVLDQVDAAAQRHPTDLGGCRIVWRRWASRAAAAGSARPRLGTSAAARAATPPSETPPPLLLLHGGHGSWNHWVRAVLPLSADRDVWAVDMPGYGDSGDPPPEPDDQVLATLLQRGLAALPLHASRIDVAGFSFGGLIGGRLALQAGPLVRRLVLVGSAGMGIDISTRPPMMAWRAATQRGDRDELHRHNLRVLMVHAPEAADDLAVRIQTLNADRTRVVSKHLSRTAKMLDWLPRMQAEVHGLWGEHDITATPSVAARCEQLRAARPDARFEIVAGAGHWVQYEAPLLFEQAMRRLLGPPPPP